MDKDGLRMLVNILQQNKDVPADVWRTLLSHSGAEERESLASMAREVAVERFGNGIYVRALIEISSYCRNNCNYCGLRSGVKPLIIQPSLLHCDSALGSFSEAFPFYTVS